MAIKKKGSNTGEQKKSVLIKLRIVLSLLFYIIWIIIGLLILFFIWANFKQGAFSGLFREASQQQTNTQVPTETNLPGVGTVNIECVQNTLSTETIQKLITDGKDSLTDEENASLEPCILDGEGEEIQNDSPAN